MSPGAQAGAQTAKSGQTIFKVQEVGTAKFKCLPVTDYGKIMALQKQRNQRKLHTADGTNPRQKYRNATANKRANGRGTSNKMNNLQGITSAETFHVSG